MPLILQPLMCSRNDSDGSSPSPAQMESGDEGDGSAAGAASRRTHKGHPQHGPPLEEELLAEARPSCRPVLLFPEHPGLAPSPFPSWLALPPQAQEKGGRIVERRPSPPLLKDRDFLSPWRMEGRSRS